MSDNLKDLIRKGDRALREGNTLVALVQFETAHAIEPLPAIKAKMAFCLAKERRQYQQAMALCLEALKMEPDNPDHYYQLSRIHLIAGQKSKAIKTLRKGLKFKRYQPIIDELVQLGSRQSPVFSSFPREHIINRSVGRLLTKIGLR